MSLKRYFIISSTNLFLLFISVASTSSKTDKKTKGRVLYIKKKPQTSQVAKKENQVAKEET